MNLQGCLFEKAAVQLKDAYPSLNLEDQFYAAQQLTLALSAMLSASTSGNCNLEYFSILVVFLLFALTAFYLSFFSEEMPLHRSSS